MKYYQTVILACIILLLSGCSSATENPYTKSGFYFDTTITITLYDQKERELLDDCFSFCKTFENQISRTVKDSEIYQINHAKGHPVKVSDTTLELIKLGIYYGELTNGAFDITIAPLSDLWDFKSNDPKLPTDSDIQNVLSYVNYENIIINGNYVSLNSPDAAIDLGGIAKGYIADYLKEYLVNKGVNSAIINLGGNVLTIGSKPDGSPFQIGIQKPFDKQNTTITAVSSTDSSIVTSGIYERYFELDDVIYHHILDTSSGFPCNNNLLSVTILSESSAAGDALSTSCFALGYDNALKLIQTLDHVDAIFITTDYEILDTRLLTE